jgi:hypothetical protein
MAGGLTTSDKSPVALQQRGGRASSNTWRIMRLPVMPLSSTEGPTLANRVPLSTDFERFALARVVLGRRRSQSTPNGKHTSRLHDFSVARNQILGIRIFLLRLGLIAAFLIRIRSLFDPLQATAAQSRGSTNRNAELCGEIVIVHRTSCIARIRVRKSKRALQDGMGLTAINHSLREAGTRCMP